MKMQQTNEHHPNSTTQNIQQEGGMVRQTFNGGNGISIIFYIHVTSQQSFRKCLSQFSGAVEGQVK